MKHNCCLFVMSISLFALCADANQIDSTTQQPSLAWVAAINMGPVWASGGETQTIYLAPEMTKTYDADQSTNTVFEGEVFLGLQKSLTSSLNGQLGLVVGATTNDNLSGDIWDDADPQFNNFTYDYSIQHTYVSVKSLLLYNINQHIIPWVSASIGAGFNHAHSFDNSPTNIDALATTNFSSHTETAFTYSVGIGVKTALNAHWQVGLGYEFSDWGPSSLGKAEGQTQNSGLSLKNLYTNGILFNLTYIGWLG